MSRDPYDLAANVEAVFRKLELRELALVLDVLGLELGRRAVPGLSSVGYAARACRERAEALERYRAIHGDDCSAPSG